MQLISILLALVIVLSPISSVGTYVHHGNALASPSDNEEHDIARNIGKNGQDHDNENQDEKSGHNNNVEQNDNGNNKEKDQKDERSDGKNSSHDSHDKSDGADKQEDKTYEESEQDKSTTGKKESDDSTKNRENNSDSETRPDHETSKIENQEHVCSGENRYEDMASFDSAVVGHSEIINLSAGSGNSGGLGLSHTSTGSSMYVYVVWDDSSVESNISNIYFKRSTNGGNDFTQNSTIVNAGLPPGMAMEADIASLGPNVYVIWTEKFVATGKTDILFTRSADYGSTFEKPIILKNNSSAVGSTPQIAVSGTNTFAVWRELNQDGSKSDVLVSRSIDCGSSFGNPIMISSPQSQANMVQIATSGTNVFVVWDGVIEPGNYDIFLVRSTDSGLSFSEPKNLSNNSDESMGQQIAVQGENVYVTWYECHDGIFFAISNDSGNTFHISKLAANGGCFLDPRIAVFEQGVYVTWTQTGIGNFGLLLRSSPDGGRSFGDAVLLSNYSYSEKSITADNSGAYVAWGEDFENRNNYQLKIARIQDSIIDALVITNSTFIPWEVSVTSSSSDLYLAWRNVGQEQTENTDVFFKKILIGQNNDNADERNDDRHNSTRNNESKDKEDHTKDQKGHDKSTKDDEKRDNKGDDDSKDNKHADDKKSKDDDKDKNDHDKGDSAKDNKGKDNGKNHSKNHDSNKDVTKSNKNHDKGSDKEQYNENDQAVQDNSTTTEDINEKCNEEHSLKDANAIPLTASHRLHAINISNSPVRSAVPSEISSIAVSENYVYVIWLETREEIHEHSENLGLFLKISKDCGATFSEPISLSNHSGQVLLGNLAVSGKNVYVTWSEIASRDDDYNADTALEGGLYFRVSHDFGESFSTAVKVNKDPYAASNHRLVATNGTVIIYWGEWNGSDDITNLRVSIDDGQTFGDIIQFQQGNIVSQNVASVAAEGKHIFVASTCTVSHSVIFWSSHDGGLTFQPAINLSEYRDGTSSYKFAVNEDDVKNWSVSSDRQCVFGPEIAVNKNKVYVIWGEVTGQGLQDPTTYTKQIANLMVTSSQDFGMTFDAPVIIGTSTIFDFINFWGSRPHIAAFDDNVYVTWDTKTDHQQNNMLFRASHDNGLSFGPTINLSSANGDSYDLHLTAAVNGTLYATWMNEAANALYLRASTDAGRSFSDVIDLTSYSNSSLYNSARPGFLQLVATEPKGDLYMTWEGHVYDLDEYDVYFMKLIP